MWGRITEYKNRWFKLQPYSCNDIKMKQVDVVLLTLSLVVLAQGFHLYQGAVRDGSDSVETQGNACKYTIHEYLHAFMI